MKILLAILAVLSLSGCTAAFVQDAQSVTKEAREASLYAMCRARPIGSWFDMYKERPKIACKLYEACLLYVGQINAPELPGCDDSEL